MPASGRLAPLAALSALLCLPACVETGDFGRVKRSAWNDAVAGTGSLAAIARDEPVSSFPLTDDEAELRERAWRFLVPAGGRVTLDRVLAEMVATRILPASAANPDPRSYFDELLDAGARSPASRYRRLLDDLSADTKLIAPFATMAERVLAADHLRRRVLARLIAPSPSEIADAEGRVAENRCLVAWVGTATRFRVVSYAHALERLVLAAPSPEAITAERALSRLAAERIVLDRLAIGSPVVSTCLGPSAGEDIDVPAALVAKG